MSIPPKSTMGRRLTPKERQSVLQLSREISELYLQNNRLIFVLGSYEEEKKSRLDEFCELVKEETVRQDTAKLMDEFLDDDDKENTELQGNQKFKIIANQADVIVGIAEDDVGGFVFEQGILVENQHLLDRTYLLRRDYGERRNQKEYSWMQDSFFNELERRGQVYDWVGNGVFNTEATRLLRDL